MFKIPPLICLFHIDDLITLIVVVPQAVRALSATLTEDLCSWVSGEDSAELALLEWSRWVDWTLPLEIRDERRVVTPVGVASDGRLRVVDPDTGKEELLATEYLL